MELKTSLVCFISKIILDLYLSHVQKLGVMADMASYNILLKACCLARSTDLAQEIIGNVKHLESKGVLKLDVFTSSTTVKVYLYLIAVQEHQQDAYVCFNHRICLVFTLLLLVEVKIHPMRLLYKILISSLPMH